MIIIISITIINIVVIVIIIVREGGKEKAGFIIWSFYLIANMKHIHDQ